MAHTKEELTEELVDQCFRIFERFMQYGTEDEMYQRLTNGMFEILKDIDGVRADKAVSARSGTALREAAKGALEQNLNAFGNLLGPG